MAFILAHCAKPFAPGTSVAFFVNSFIASLGPIGLQHIGSACREGIMYVGCVGALLQVGLSRGIKGLGRGADGVAFT
jgi:hypothetical protein